MIEMINWVCDSTESAFLCGTALYAVCFAGNQAYSKLAAWAKTPHHRQGQAHSPARVTV